MFYYVCFGLSIGSDFVLPELTPGGHGEDVYIRRGEFVLPKVEATSIRRNGIEAFFGGSSQAAYLHWPEVVSVLAEEGRTLTVTPADKEISSRLLNQFILSEALGIVLYQRGYFLLHASAVKAGEGAIAFVGCPGAGKSTTAAAFARCGHPVLSDDMVALDLKASHEILIQPGFDNVKVSPSAARWLGYDLSALATVFPNSEKRIIKQEKPLPTTPVSLSGIYILENGPQLSLKRLTGMKAFIPLLRFFPCPSKLLKGPAVEYLHQCQEIYRRVPIVQIQCPRNLDCISQLVKGPRSLNGWLSAHLVAWPSEVGRL
jgi:hypothetical protein